MIGAMTRRKLQRKRFVLLDEELESLIFRGIYASGNRNSEEAEMLSSANFQTVIFEENDLGNPIKLTIR